MPLDPEVVKRIIKDPAFQQLNPDAQVDTMRRYLTQSDEQYPSLPHDKQFHTAAQIIEAHQPGIVSKIADMLPVIGPIKRAVEDPNAVRPWTRAAAGFLGAEDAIKSPLGAGVAEGLREVAEFAALSAVGGPIMKAVGAPVAASLVGKAGPAMLERGLVAGATESVVAGAAKINLEKLVTRAVTDGTIGALYGVADVIERSPDHPLTHIGVSTVAAGAFGAALGGLHYARNKFGPDAARQAIEALQSDPELAASITRAKPIRDAYARAAGVAPESAGDVVTRAISGELLDVDEFRIMRGVLTSEPNFLRTDEGLRILQTQKEHLLPKAKAPEPEAELGPLRVHVERPSGRVETIIDPSPAQLTRMMADHYRGSAFITEAEGTGADAFIEQARDGGQLFAAYKKSLPLAEQKRVERIPEIEAQEYFNSLAAQEHATRMRQETQQTVRAPGLEPEPQGAPRGGQQTFVEGHPTQAPTEGTVYRPEDYVPGAPNSADLLMETLRKHGVDAQRLTGEQLGSSLDPVLRDLAPSGPARPGFNPLTGEGVEGINAPRLPPGAGIEVNPITGERGLYRPMPTGQISASVDPTQYAYSPTGRGQYGYNPATGYTIYRPMEPESPVVFRGAAGTEGGVVEADTVVAKVVRQPSGRKKVTTPMADGSEAEMVRATPMAEPEPVQPPRPMQTRKKPGPVAQEAVMKPISELTDDEVTQAIKYYRRIAQKEDVSEDDINTLVALNDRNQKKHLTAQDLARCVRLR